MKVKDLILRLQNCNPDAMVVVDGYEGGYDEICNVRDELKIALNVHIESYYGSHEHALEGDYPDADYTIAVYLKA